MERPRSPFPLAMILSLALAAVLAAAPPDSTVATGHVIDAEGDPIPDATVALVDREGAVLAEAEMHDRASFYVRHRRERRRQGFPTDLRVQAPGYVTRVLPLANGEIKTHEDGRFVQLDVVLEVGRTLRVRLAHEDDRPVAGARVEIRRPVGPKPDWSERPLLAEAATTDADGAVEFADMASSGVAYAVVTFADAPREWMRVPLDLAEAEHVVLVPQPCWLTVEFADGLTLIPGVETDAVGIRALSESPRGWRDAREDFEIRGLRRGEVVSLQLVTNDGVALWLRERVRIERPLQTVRIESIEGVVERRREPPRPYADRLTYGFKLVDGSGEPVTWADIGGYAARDLVAAWTKGEETGRAPAQLDGQYGSRAPVRGSFDVPVDRPFEVKIEGRLLRTEIGEVSGESLFVDLGLDVEETLGPHAPVTFRGADGSDPGGGWALEMRRDGDLERFVAACEAGNEDHRIRTRLPRGRYTFSAYSGPLGGAAGAFEVNGTDPVVVSVAFPGSGSIQGTFDVEHPVLGLQLVRNDGAIHQDSGARNVLLRPGGRWSAIDVLAGEYALVAKLLTPDGALAVTVAEGLRVAPDALTDVGTIEWRADAIHGPIVRRDPAGLWTTASVYDGRNRSIWGGPFLPGDGVVVPRDGVVRVQLGSNSFGEPARRQIRIPIDGDAAVIDF